MARAIDCPTHCRKGIKWVADLCIFNCIVLNIPVAKYSIAKESIKRMEAKVREITSRTMRYAMGYRIAKLNQHLIGWCGYFALADTKSVFKELDGWIRRRLR